MDGEAGRYGVLRLRRNEQVYWRLLGGRIWVKRDKGKARGGENGQV